MSTIPGYTLEAFVMWRLDLIVGEDRSANLSLSIAELMGVQTRRRTITTAQFQSVLTIFEPYRIYVERRLHGYDEECMSWRDYTGFGAFDDIPNECYSKADEILNDAVNASRQGKANP